MGHNQKLIMVYRGKSHWMIKFVRDFQRAELFNDPFVETEWPLTWDTFRVELQVKNDFPGYNYGIQEDK